MSSLEENKRADQTSTSVLILLAMALISFLVIFFIVKNLMSGAEEATMDLVCKASITARAKSVIRVGPECYGLMLFDEKKCIMENPTSKLQTLPFLCKTKRYELEGTKQQIIQGFANAMEVCWAQFGEGRFPHTIDDASKPNTCFPCSTILVKKIKVEGKEDIPVITSTDIEEFLNTHEIQYLNTTETYKEYFTDHEGIPGHVVVPDKIVQNTAYYVMYSDPAGAALDHPNGIYAMAVDVATNMKVRMGTKDTGFIFLYRPQMEESCTLFYGIGGG